MLDPDFCTKIKRDLKKYRHKKDVIEELDKVLKILLQETKLPEKYSDHPLAGNYNGYRECHVKPDDLLIYRVDSMQKILYLARFGSHSELF
jgi:addiction module toxin, RelE/StbE family